MDEIKLYLAKLLNYQIYRYSNNLEIKKSLKILVDDLDIANYLETQQSADSFALDDSKFQNILGGLNEKTNKRKANGVYYTSNDVSRYIIINSILNKFYIQETVSDYAEGYELLNNLSDREKNELLFKLKIIDPTCGSGEFLINAFDIKKDLCLDLTDDSILKISKTIFGNDIDPLSILITKLRLFFYIAGNLKKKESYLELAKIIKNQFFCVDFVSNHKDIKLKFDNAVGKPPYVEYGKYSDTTKLENKFGNIYADVLLNSFDILERDGIMGYIIPLSYAATPRMKLIREFIRANTEKQFVLSFADRPDCLFNGVHQKLNILIAKRGNVYNVTYTSSYKYWYKQERDFLFNSIDVIKNEGINDNFIPKLGNEIEQKIYNKIYTNNQENIYKYVKKSEFNIYLNMRACFWIKSFSFHPGSKEYKEFSFPEKYRDYILCLMNSSLFWFFWIVVSDCWHITTKELEHFLIKPLPDNIDFEMMAKKLEKNLEKTKKYIGTKQTEYEYKHKFCKDIIDEIDDKLAVLYNLTKEETEYVKNFALKYRKGDGINEFGC